VLELPELESKSTNPWLRRLRQLALAARIGGMIFKPLPDVALPVEPPPIVQVDQRQKRRGQAGPGSRESEVQMARLGRLAATCRDEGEAEAYIGALPTLAVQVAPGAAAPLLASSARLTRGLSDATRFLRAHPATRGMVTALPVATRNAALRLEKQVRAGRPVTSDTCARVLAEECVRALTR
jgi:hypothetical protein